MCTTQLATSESRARKKAAARCQNRLNFSSTAKSWRNKSLIECSITGEVVHLQTCFTREPKHSKLSLSRWDQTVSFLIDFGSVRCGVLISSIHTTTMASPFYFASRDLADFNDPKRRSLNHRSDLNKCDRRSLINEEWNRCTSEAEPVPAGELERNHVRSRHWQASIINQTTRN